MSTRLRVLGIALVLSLVSCVRVTKPFVPSSRAETIQVRIGTARTLSDGAVIGFRAVTGDNRCPAEVYCIIAGSASIRLMLRPPGGRPTEFDAFITGSGRRDSTLVDSVVVRGYAIQLLQLDPYPSISERVELNRYTAHLRVRLPRP